jgi:hypothetical protein
LLSHWTLQKLSLGDSMDSICIKNTREITVIPG